MRVLRALKLTVPTLLLAYLALLLTEYRSFQAVLGDPWGRAVYVKLHNPDIAPGTPHIERLTRWAREHGYRKILVIHNAGKVGYSHFWYNGVLIVQLAWYDYRTVFANPDWNLILKDILYGHRGMVGEWVADRQTFDTIDQAVRHVRDLLRSVPGPTMVVWHGSCRWGHPIWRLGCGSEPYYWILARYGGRVLALTLVALGDFSPFVFYGRDAWAELRNHRKIQELYNSGYLNAHSIDPNLREVPPPEAAPRGAYE